MKAQLDLYPTERKHKILELLEQAGRVTVTELSQLFTVSEVTIRSDLQILAAQDLIVRTHGGALPATRSPELSLNLRRQQQALEKERIGEAAVGLVENGDAIFLDASSTALALARRLTHFRDLTILTHSLAVAEAMIGALGVTVVVSGGIFQRDTMSFIGLEGLPILGKYNIKSGFFGAHGLSYPEGLTDISAAEAEVKREIVSACRQVIALIDATKWGRVGPASFAHPQDIHMIITDLNAPMRLVEEARNHGARVRQV